MSDFCHLTALTKSARLSSGGEFDTLAEIALPSMYKQITVLRLLRTKIWPKSLAHSHDRQGHIHQIFMIEAE